MYPSFWGSSTERRCVTDDKSNYGEGNEQGWIPYNAGMCTSRIISSSDMIAVLSGACFCWEEVVAASWDTPQPARASQLSIARDSHPRCCRYVST